MMTISIKSITAICALLVSSASVHSQEVPERLRTLSGRIELAQSGATAAHKSAVVVWLKAVDHALGDPPRPGQFTLVQKNRMFTPHLLVVPVGSVVNFPNADPFFHNVFSLFNGKRFDLGLYEAGSMKQVTFSREGVSYIFCNIHPEMSAVVLSLSTSLFAVADSSAHFAVEKVPPGQYDLHVWIEGTPQPALDRLTRRIDVRENADNNVLVDASNTPRPEANHLNKFGKPYDPDVSSPY